MVLHTNEGRAQRFDSRSRRSPAARYVRPRGRHDGSHAGRGEASREKWKSFFAAWIGYLLDGFDCVLVPLVLPEIADDFGPSTAESASLVSGAFGRKSAMVAGILPYSVGTFACGFAWTAPACSRPVC